MTYKTHVMALIVKPAKEPIFSEMATIVRIEDESGVLLIEVEQHGRTDLGKICINPDEWPALRDAIDKMIAVCAEIDEEATK